ncbi:16582_t:CDS:2, partial [Gigaspora margarita]
MRYIPTHVPRLVADLIIQCWNADPDQRPSSKNIVDTLDVWNNEILNNEITEFISQIKEADRITYGNITSHFETHPEAFYVSRQIHSLNTTDFNKHSNHLNNREDNLEDNREDSRSLLIIDLAQCMHCKNFDLCNDCESHCNHDQSHAFVKIKWQINNTIHLPHYDNEFMIL